jgi:hypothetical protein
MIVAWHEYLFSAIIGRIAAVFFAELYFFAGFRQKRALRNGSVCSPIDSRALAGH